ncbi:MAG: adenylate/guanylate cyclase domain-containing protein [Mariprofundaceae bacterium]|nr:adenylate/guanylate cyclase domain-containing protein [Mariprofundaceae bacterium]
MLSLPTHLLQYLSDIHLKGLNPAWIKLDHDGLHIAEFYGDWAYYCSKPLSVGMAADALHPVLFGLLPMTENFHLSQISLENDGFFDLDILWHKGVCWLLFSDVTAIMQRFQDMQQTSNNLHLMNSRYKQTLERHMGSLIVEKVHSGDFQLEEEGVRQHITTLFVDIRSFTVFNEAHDAQVVMSTVNQYLDVMLKSVLSHAGIVDKITGDGAMTVFGVMPHEQSSEILAFEAALMMMEHTLALNAKRAKNNLEQLKIGIGIASGEAVVGIVGTHERRAFTAFGRHVNLAARLESKAPAGFILLDDPTKQALRNNYDQQSFDLTHHHLKGIGDMPVWQVKYTSDLWLPV